MVVRTINDYPPYTHDLRELAKLAGLGLNSEQERILEIISTFNIAGRYAGAKFEFYKKYNNKQHAEKYLEITNNLLKWLKKEFQQKLKK